jgi:hypothetical protein
LTSSWGPGGWEKVNSTVKSIVNASLMSLWAFLARRGYSLEHPATSELRALASRK